MRNNVVCRFRAAIELPGRLLLVTFLMAAPGAVTAAEAGTLDRPAPVLQTPDVADGARQKADAAVFASVGDAVITLQEYQTALQQGMRKRFYHGNIPEAELAQFQREIGENLVNRELLMQEATRSDVAADLQWVDKQLAAYETRYGNNVQWSSNREQILSALRPQLEEQSILNVLERQVREVPEPSHEQLRAYYENHPEKFTEPEQFRASILLLKVDPSSAGSVWDAAIAEAQDLVKRVHAGTDFTELVQLHSEDYTAKNNGDMGYMHHGMIATVAQQAIDELQPGQITGPVRLLEGIAIFRLEERKKARLNTYEKVSDRARHLWSREQADLAWKGLLKQLRASTPIRVNEEYYLAEKAGNGTPDKNAGAPNQTVK